MDSQENQKLQNIFHLLTAADRATLLSFAEFLASRSDLPAIPEVKPAPPPEPVPEPKLVPRPKDEKVVGAVKRLSKSYSMLDKRKMLGVTSDLMTKHILQNVDAEEVINDLERIFDEHYQQLLQEQKD